MHYRKLGKTNFQVSEVSLGAWQIGAGWGDVSNEDAIRVLNAAIDNGVNFIDTADVYGDGWSERFIAQVLGDRKEEVFVATKAGRRLQPHVASGYNRDNLTSFVERSLQNLRRDSAKHIRCRATHARVGISHSDHQSGPHSDGSHRYLILPHPRPCQVVLFVVGDLLFLA